MLSIAIKEENSHFEHGLKIIISHLANQWHQEICFLPVENIDRADIAFISPMKIGSAPIAIRFRSIPAANTGLSSATETIKISWCSGPACTCCRWSIGKMTLRKWLKISPHPAKRALRNNVPATICHYCTTRNFSVDERKFLMFLASGYTLAETAHLLSISDLQAKATRRGIMKSCMWKTISNS